MGAKGSTGAFADLAVRAITGVVFGAVAMAALLAGGAWSTLLIAVLAALMVFEWRMISLDERESAVAGFQILSVVGAVTMAHFGDLNAAIAFLFAVAGAGAAADALLERASVWGLLGAMYIGLAAIFFVAIRGDDASGLMAVAWVAVVVIATDVGAYFSGRIIGGPKLWRRVSPNKTWAGLAGGMALAGLASAAFSILMLDYLELFLVVLGAVTAIIAQAGDMLESAYKRYFKVKDSGAILPGHGGVLDRLDGMLAAIIFVAIVTIARGGAPIYAW